MPNAVHRFLTHPQLAWILLWIGLAFLILALLVMIRTSWGQSRPLRKCAALSLLAHLLLAGYATTVHIVTGVGGTHRGGVNLLLVDGSADGTYDGYDESVADGSALGDSHLPSAGIPDAIPNQTTESRTAGVVAVQPAAVKSSEPPPLLESHDEHPVVAVRDPPAIRHDEAQPSEKPDETKVAADPPPDRPQTTATSPGTDSTNDSKLVEKPSEPLPAANVASSVPNLPEPVNTDVGNWVSGPPDGANLTDQQISQGPVNDAPGDNAKTLVDVQSPEKPVAADPNERAPTSPVVTGPQQESVNAPIASRGLPEIYADRMAGDRLEVARRRGGSAEGESAVQAALRWLAANQSADGRWDADKFGARQETASLGTQRQGAGGTGSHADTAVTGLSLLAFLAAGNTHLHGDYAQSVQHGLEYLLNIQGRDGNLAGQAEVYAFMYCHGMATFALSEAFAMTGDKRLEAPLKAAIGYTISAQIPITGGWRYKANEPASELGDTSQLGWQLMALKSAEMAGIEIPSKTHDGVVRYIKAVSFGPHGGIASYQPGVRKPSRTMTAEALVCRQFVGMTRENPAGDEAGDYLLGDLPRSDKINLYYWYYGTLGMYQLQGDHWKRWNEALQPTLIGRQRVDGELAGSWDPECVWGGYGGRVYSTALSALCLEVYYRYLPIYRVATRQTQPGN